MVKKLSVLIIAIVCVTHVITLTAKKNFDLAQQNMVEKLYNRWYSKYVHDFFTGHSFASSCVGACANSPLSKWYIKSFVKKYQINCEEIELPITAFKTFNQFFARTLKKDARPLPQDPDCVISPADGSVLVIPNINNNMPFPIKGAVLNVEKLLGDARHVPYYRGGTIVIVRLAPWDYHRMHFPLSGTPLPSQRIHGVYESVHPFVYRMGIQPLEVNERELIFFETEGAGTVALIPVGALFVGSIINTYIPGKKHMQGDEIGYFSFGGSTIVMVFAKDTVTVEQEYIINSAQGKETPVKMGVVIGKLNPQAADDDFLDAK